MGGRGHKRGGVLSKELYNHTQRQFVACYGKTQIPNDGHLKTLPQNLVRGKKKKILCLSALHQSSSRYHLSGVTVR
jgi:hypothetical protein